MKFSLFKILLLSCLFLLPVVSEAQQDGMFNGKNKHKHRHRGRRERKNKDAYNPYIDHDTNKPKKLATKESNKDAKKVHKKAKKQIRKEKKKLRRTKGAYK
ncbi:MAG: hypothetical protein K0S33_1254 [Bacteroidetes bacterium]|jgi:hypothetical protein|nr:hypothetical protein [Bacteroidota bacterium]